MFLTNRRQRRVKLNVSCRAGTNRPTLRSSSASLRFMVSSSISFIAAASTDPDDEFRSHPNRAKGGSILRSANASRSVASSTLAARAAIALRAAFVAGNSPPSVAATSDAPGTILWGGTRSGGFRSSSTTGAAAVLLFANGGCEHLDRR